MNLNSLYNLLAARTNPDGSICLPSWHDIAAAAECDPLDDARALRSLIEKGAVNRVPVRNTFGDFNYVLRRPAPGFERMFEIGLRTLGATVGHILQPLEA